LAKKIETCISNVSDFINDIPTKHEIIIGGNLNAVIGTNKEEENEEDTIFNLIGPHKNPRINDTGRLVRDMLREQVL